ncbi:Murein hydrolase activator NlpD precursor [Pannonibacter phragmitetus]|uniref:Murein hydrolase activator NlpD n=2 Tax=Pannonibacter phragmitetus TaxID=121719 RepID=A0A378ZW67_9HYPH|nr:Murein hydrolase activator NlpD precursor [Pannonibacter phragmitetus]
MANPMREYRSSLRLRVAAICVLASFGAGCSGSMERFADGPIYTGSTPNQRSILAQSGGGQPTYQDVVAGNGGSNGGLPASGGSPRTTGSVSGSSLPPLGQSSSSPAPQPVAALPAPAQSALDLSQAQGERSWRGWSSAGGTRVTARQNESVASMGQRFGVPADAIAAVNGIDKNAPLQAGQTVLIPTYSTAGVSAQQTTLPAAGASPATTGTVAPAAQQLAAVSAPDRKPAGARQSAAAQPAQPQPVARTNEPKPAAPIAALREVPASSLPANAQPAIEAMNSAAGEGKPVQTASIDPEETVGGPMFRWPVRGRVISEFGSKPGGARNDGINLAVPEGTPVKAAGDGSVIYAGNELQGFGNLVLIRHADGWVSAYAHNSEILVKRGDEVQRGQVISKAGATGNVSQPQVHFELRQGNRPVDPTRYLPKG